MTWCEHCRGDFESDHYDGGSVHSIGVEFGPFGLLLAKAQISDELAYALEVHLSGGQGEIAGYSIKDADEFAADVLRRFHELEQAR